jgi:hypothetical protein
VTTIFGFLSQRDAYTIELPPEVDPRVHLGSSAGISPNDSLSIQCAPADLIDFEAFGWTKSFDVNGPDSNVSVYQSASVPDAIMPAWEFGNWRIWMQLRCKPGTSQSQLLADFVTGLRIALDSYGIPRITLGGQLVHGDLYLRQEDREVVLFEVPGTTSMVMLRYDGALGVEGSYRDGDFVWATATTPFGITIQRDGMPGSQDEVLSAARELAATVRRVA